MMANIYRTLLREIEADGFQVLHQRISLTPLRKLWIAMRTNWRGQLMAPRPRGVAVDRRRLGRARRGGRGDAPRGHAVTLFEMAPQPAAARAPSRCDGRRRSTTASTSASAPIARRCA